METLACGVPVPISGVLRWGGWLELPRSFRSVPVQEGLAPSGGQGQRMRPALSAELFPSSGQGPWERSLGMRAGFIAKTRELTPSYYYMLVIRCFLGARHRITRVITIHSFVHSFPQYMPAIS